MQSLLSNKAGEGAIQQGRKGLASMGSTVNTSQLNCLPALLECHLLCHMLPAISSFTSAPAFAEDATFLSAFILWQKRDEGLPGVPQSRTNFPSKCPGVRVAY